MHSDDPLIAALREWTEIFHGRASRGLFRFAKEKGLSMSQLGALLHLNHAAGGGVTDLGEEMGVTSAAASQMLERLVQQGFILRTEHPSDRRAKQLVLTEQGRQIVRASLHARQDWLDDLASSFTAAEKEQLAQALTILIEKTKTLDVPPEAGE